MSRVARYGKAVCKPGRGQAVADLLLAAAADLEGDAGCELYPVNRQADAPDTIWVTELWRDQAALDASLERVRASEGPRRIKEQIDSFAMIELDLLGGKAPRA